MCGGVRPGPPGVTLAPVGLMLFQSFAGETRRAAPSATRNQRVVAVGFSSDNVSTFQIRIQLSADRRSVQQIFETTSPAQHSPTHRPTHKHTSTTLPHARTHPYTAAPAPCCLTSPRSVFITRTSLVSRACPTGRVRGFCRAIGSRQARCPSVPRIPEFAYMSDDGQPVSKVKGLSLQCDNIGRPVFFVELPCTHPP
jgi:hypothetical protein